MRWIMCILLLSPLALRAEDKRKDLNVQTRNVWHISPKAKSGTWVVGAVKTLKDGKWVKVHDDAPDYWMEKEKNVWVPAMKNADGKFVLDTKTYSYKDPAEANRTETDEPPVCSAGKCRPPRSGKGLMGSPTDRSCEDDPPNPHGCCTCCCFHHQHRRTGVLRFGWFSHPRRRR